jgi:sulfotransferase
MGGLTRSGGTLLSAILNQNPDIHVSEVSPICDLTYKVNQLFDYSTEYNACPFENRRINVLKSLIDNYYYDIDAKYIIDKQHSWTTEYNISMIKSLYTDNVKIICPVRNVLEILSSYITLLKKNKNNISFIDREILKFGAFNVSEDELNDLRCDWLMSKHGTLRSQLMSLEYCLNYDHKNMILFVEYDDLVSNPKKEINKIYNFLEIKHFNHNFKEISYTSSSLDNEVYGISNLHSIRKKIKKTSPKIEEVLSKKTIEKYKNLEFWRNIKQEI